MRHVVAEEDSWWLYNDSVRKRVTGPDSLDWSTHRGQTYMLFYIRTDLSCGDQIFQQSVPCIKLNPLIIELFSALR